MPNPALPITSTSVRYVKLGEGGCWEHSALSEGTIEAGFEEIDHSLALSGDWNSVRQHYRDRGVRPGVATRYANELKTFYEADADTLWITFAKGYLWWAFAEPEVHWRGKNTRTEGARFRRTIGGWRKADIAGGELKQHALSTRLTQVTGYRGTICSITAKEYLLDRINARPRPQVATVRQAEEELVASLATLVEGLHWAEFELLVALIFSRSGWRRVSEVGGTMRDVDLMLEQPLTGERIAVQVKSKAGQGVLNECLAAFSESGLASRFYFVCHSPAAGLTVPPQDVERVTVWGLKEIARTAVEAGLVGWIVDRAG